MLVAGISKGEEGAVNAMLEMVNVNTASSVPPPEEVSGRVNEAVPVAVSEAATVRTQPAPTVTVIFPLSMSSPKAVLPQFME